MISRNVTTVMKRRMMFVTVVTQLKMKEMKMESVTNSREHHPMEDYLFLAFCIVSCIQLLLFFDQSFDALLTAMLTFNAITPISSSCECDIGELFSLSFGR